jgi:Rhodopirellula transposase DDE domain
LDDLVRDATAGDPIKGLKWTKKTSRKLSRVLKRRGYKVGPDTVRRLLRQRRYVLRANRKRLNKKRDPDRDRQMRYLARWRRAYQKAGFPVISVDAKQRELIGNFKNPGRTWRQTRLDVLESDYPSEAEGVAIPYGIYDLTRDEGFVVVGTSHQTSQFAVAAIRLWWIKVGRRVYPGKKHLLIEADCGGANGNRCWLWKYGLQQLADEFGLTITVTHLPTNASKWNPIEHKLFCHIEQNWAGQPLISYETMLKFIRTTRTETGLQCQAYLDATEYGTGLKITTEQKAQINLTPHRVLPRWNYTIEPRHGARKMEK